MKNKISLLIGDYMFSQALQNMIKMRDFDALDLLSDTARKLSEGEILQIEKAIKKDMTEKIYFDINDDYISKFNIYCLINLDKKEEAQLHFDLLKEQGFEDNFFEKNLLI